MVIKADGSKWACQSCLKGHRVSGCTHTDRELTLVPKKGRPVTQCQHCRQERKKRSAHVGCDCGDAQKPHHPKEKCIHLREAEERAKAGFHDDHPVESAERSAAHLAAVAQEQGCCCPHGGKCSCAILKKEVDKDKSTTPPHGPAVKPKLESTKSDGHITVFQNGHHKPCHRKNHAAHESGLPYKLPMTRHSSDHSVKTKARRSVDSLALENNGQFHSFMCAPPTNDAPFHPARRQSKSEQPSPKLSGADAFNNSMSDMRFAEVDFSNLGPSMTNLSQQSGATGIFDFASTEPASAIADSSYDPWSALPSADSAGIASNNFFGAWPTNVDPTGMVQPALTAASSGTQSEIDELPPMDDLYGFTMPSIQEVDGGFSGATGLGSPGLNRRSLPADFKPIDITSPTAESDWQNMVGGMNAPSTDNLMGYGSSSQPNYNDWQTASGAPKSPRPRGLPMYGRSASRSLGPSSAPANDSDDLMRQLFPEMENTPSMFSPTKDPLSGTAGMDFGPMDENLDFTAHQWNDGSMSMPTDNASFPSPFDMSRNYSNPDFMGDWSQ
ncbi:Copper resistance protein [Teratosphaeria destructans]|uniref:Copper resistance protein n=1 Tax=Teratosphaeria destructans TaxID=418781 RepID=A0A9W7SSF7_9PEZI|nr:Copper resistance protein [Teratosphaeria destructans]